MVEFQGCRFAFKVCGSGEPVVLIQGVGLHGDGWQPQTDALSSESRCLTFDNRGMGASQPAGGQITVEQMALDTVAVMDAAGFAGGVHFVGHSLGGAIALQIALTNPGRVKSLSLLCTSARGADATGLSWKLLWVGMRTRIGTRAMRRRAFLEIIMAPAYLTTQDRDALAARLGPTFGHDLADTPPVVMRQLDALKRFDASGRLATLGSKPTLVLSATHDIIFPPRCGRALAAGIPGARYIEMPDCGHGATIQAADAVNEVLMQLIRSSTLSGQGTGC
jgi:pimeloyl-ACP methyl ester carboxylesterase